MLSLLFKIQEVNIMNIEYVVMVVGVGGTGGNFAKEFARYASFYKKQGQFIKMILIDGDKVESKNQERQPFIAEDVQQGKALTLANAINDSFDGLEEVLAYPHYIEDKAQLEDLFSSVKMYDGTSDKSIPVIVGAVDNHRARQCLYDFYCSRDDVFWYDSANEFSVGEVVISARLNGCDIGWDRTKYFPDVLTDDSPSASELSCGVVNISSPQHLATNLMAANLVLSAVVDLMSNNKFVPGIIYFNREEYFSRFQKWEEV